MTNICFMAILFSTDLLCFAYLGKLSIYVVCSKYFVVRSVARSVRFYVGKIKGGFT